ncbi:hypothetical protein F4781DRAFT_277880 [Annulohypoxylon bovei var. microspora]|nr:hypothetical protein F4781DRAFT_277880 [Annulohypoxylon bovei var. microspora]
MPFKLHLLLAFPAFDGYLTKLDSADVSHRCPGDRSWTLSAVLSGSQIPSGCGIPRLATLDDEDAVTYLHHRYHGASGFIRPQMVYVGFFILLFWLPCWLAASTVGSRQPATAMPSDTGASPCFATDSSSLLSVAISLGV